MKKTRLIPCLLALSAPFWLAACGGSPQQYFRLSAAGTAPTRAAGLAVGVGPVTLPGYIDRPELVFQSGDNQFQIPTSAHWAGSLKENVGWVLADDLGRHLASSNVVPAPWPPNTRLRYQVGVDVRQFHAISGGDAILEVFWTIEDPENRQVLRRRNARFSERVAGDGYAPVVAAESRLLDQFAQAIAASLPSRR